MDDKDTNDKNKLDEILNEINNLKKYSKQLQENTKGEKLDNYINNLSKSINNLEDKVETSFNSN